MKQLVGFKEEIHKCSKCGLCQAECPIYKVTGNDCTVSRGLFVMLYGMLKGELKMSQNINRYLDLCLKCGACSKNCPSGVNAVDIIIAAKAEYFKQHPIEKFKTFMQKYFVFGLFPRIVRTFIRPTRSQKFEKKVIYFGGCGSKFKGDKSIVKLLNAIEVEVINPVFHCCGVPYFTRGDLNEFQNSLKSYISILKKYNIKEVIVNCASCEKSLKDYIKWAEDADKEILQEVNVQNIYEYLHKQNITLELKKEQVVTYHKPCNLDNYEDVLYLLNATKNLQYIQMNDFDKCCGLNGISKFKEYKIMKEIFASKRDNIKKTGAKTVLTSCLGCEAALKGYSFGQYKTVDFIDFIARNSKPIK